jgi:RHS repeat-associated protein
VQQDFALPGPMPLVWERTYRTSHALDLGLGAGWIIPWFARLDISHDKVVYFDGEGRDIPFSAPPEGDGCRNNTEKLTLYCDSSTQYRVVTSDNLVYTFRGAGKYRRLNSIVDRDDHSIELNYSDSGRLTHITDSAGRRLKLEYNITNHLRKVYLLNDQGEPQDDPLVQYSYDNKGDLVAVTDSAGNPHRFSYRNHVITQRTTKDGFNYFFEWDRYDTQARCLRNWGERGIYDYHFEYDPDNKITRSTDGRGYTTVYFYNEFGKITKELDPEGGITEYAYDSTGQLTLQKDSEGNTTRFTYNEDGKLTKVINASGQTTALSYDRGGRPVELTDSQSNQWQRQYDAKGRLSAVIDPHGNTTRYQYDEAGNPVAVTDALGRSHSFAWNERGELLSQTDPAGNQTQYQYDALGRITTLTDSQGLTTQYGYDKNSNINQVYHPDGSSIQMRYTPEGRLTHYTDAIGRTTHYRYDGLSQPVERIDPNGQRFRYEYDAERNLTALINENGERYQLQYDKNERLVKEIGFDGRAQSYAYNSAGHLTRHTDGADRLTIFERDELGRLLQKQSSDGELSLFTYDPIGRLQQAVNNHAELHFKYNALGQLIEEQQNDQNIQHRYDALGQKIQTVLPNGDNIDYQYDNLGLFTQVTFNGQTVTQVQRNTLGQEVQRTTGAISSRNDYDPMGRLIRQQAVKDQNPIIDRRYRYDKAGNLRQIDDFKQGVTRFHYDALDRLKAVEGQTPERFSFDPAGNLLDAETPAQGGYVKGNRLHVFQDYRFEYDDVGNLITEKKGKHETRFHYNAQNQLIKAEKDGQTFEYAYDPFGRRISKKDAFGETTFLWNGDVLLSEQRQNINITYLHEPGSFKPLAQVRDDKVYHYHNDHLGTPQLVTDNAGDVVWEARYKVYGNVVQYEVEAVENNIRFQGQYFDAETGLHYNRNRYYHPVIGRFTTVDPIGLFGGNNNYEYAPNPTGWIDPLGLKCGEVAKTREEFDKKFPREQFPSPEHADEAWKVYQDTSKGNAEIVMGRLPDTKAGSDLGMQRLASDKWSKEVNDAWVQGGIDANKKFYLGSDINIGNLRSQPYPHSRYPTTIFMRELKQLRAAGYKRVGDYMVPPT